MASLRARRRTRWWSILLLLPLTVLLRHSSTRPPTTLRTLPEERTGHCGRKPPVFVFLHLHKTGGNTLKRALFAFAKRNNLFLHHTCHVAPPDTALQHLYFGRHKSASALECNLAQVPTTPIPDLIVGHQRVGVHAMFPRCDVRYFTLVRNPLSRKAAHFRHFEKGGPAAFAEYLVHRNRNYMTKRLATAAINSEVMADIRDRFIDSGAFPTRAALRAAKANIVRRFFFIGLQERYNESVCILGKILNHACSKNGRLAQRWRLDPRKVTRASVNIRGGNERRVIRLPGDVLSAARVAEAADIELYQFAQRLFKRKLAIYPECR